MVNGTIEAEAGRLYVLTDWEDSVDEKSQYRRVWKTPLRQGDHGHLVGTRVMMGRETSFEFEIPGTRPMKVPTEEQEDVSRREWRDKPVPQRRVRAR